MGNSIATVTGTALVPGVSKNRRLYTPELIGKAVERAQRRIAEGGPPLTMRVAHPEPGKEHIAPVTEIVGRITRIWQEPDGRARFEAAIADTPAGRTVAALVDNRNGDPYLRNVSIRGEFHGQVRRVVNPDGSMAETADDLELHGADFTHKPGVAGAEIEQVADPDDGSRESSPDGRAVIYESVQEALVTAIDEANAPAEAATAGDKKPYGDVPYADPGYLKDGQKRYPIDSKAHARAAWSYVNQAKNARQYSANQLKRIKQRIIKALKGFGVQVAAQEGWLIDHVGVVSESAAEAMGYEPNRDGSFCINLTNGPLNVTISSYCINPADLDVIGRAAMAAACDALTAMDPDLDGDIDVAGAPAEDDDNDAPEAAADGEAPVVEATETAPASPEAAPPAPEPAADLQPETEAPAMSEPTTPAVEPTPAATTPAPVAGITFTDEQFKAFLDRFAPVAAAAPAESAPAVEAPAQEAAPAVAESDEDRIARLVEERVNARVTEALQSQVASGTVVPQRKGLVAPVTESAAGTGEYGYPEGWPQKPLHQYTDEERAKYLESNLVGAILKGRGQQA